MSAEAWEELRRDYLRAERPSAKACVKRLARRAEAAGWSLPSERTMERRLAPCRAAMRVLKRDGLQALKDLFPPQQPRQERARRARDRQRRRLRAQRLGEGRARARLPAEDLVLAGRLQLEDPRLAHRRDRAHRADPFSFGALCEAVGHPARRDARQHDGRGEQDHVGRHRASLPFSRARGRARRRLQAARRRGALGDAGHGQAKPIERLFGIGGAGEYIDKAPELAGAWSGASVFDKPEYDGRTARRADRARAGDRARGRGAGTPCRGGAARFTTGARSTRCSPSPMRRSRWCARSEEQERSCGCSRPSPCAPTRATVRSRSTPVA
jgi:putative transposase